MYQTSISGFEGLYEINTAGQVISLERPKRNTFTAKLPYRVLIPLRREGYEYVVLHKEGEKLDISIHRLMCLTFLPNPENKKFVNHLNGVRNNNPLWNVEWATPKENAQHAYDTGLQVGIRNENHYLSKPVIQLTRKGEFVKEWPSMNEVTRSLGYVTSTISACCKGIRKTAYNYKWKFKWPSLA